jgi:hypothetical protein
MHYGFGGIPMPVLRPAVLVCLLAVSSFVSHGQDKNVTFPTNEEIRLVLTQTKRAVEEYKLLIGMEEKMLGKDRAEAVTKDREVVSSIELAVAGFGKNPQAFNSSLGFSFFEWIDDASRNALLCSSNAMGNSVTSVLAGTKDKATADMQLSQSCLNVSTLLYTVSENAGALYTRYVQAQEQLTVEATKTAQDCARVLKEKGVSSKQ